MIDEANQDSQDDMAVPKWPNYENPVTQKSEIESELAQIKKTSSHWKKLYDDALKTQKDKKRFEAVSETKKKQKEIELSHNIQVDKIKYDIYNDRQTFLQ